MKINRNLCLCFCTGLFLGSITAQASDDFLSNWGLPFSASVGVGTLQDTTLNLNSRVLNVFSLEALPGYRRQHILVGLHLDYRWQGQMTSVAGAGGTNLRGQGFLAGLGVRGELSEKLFIQGSMDFLGGYDLSQNTVSNEDDGFKSPLGLRIKAGYAFLKEIPNLTFDADLQYMTFDRIQISGIDVGASTRQVMVSVGVTYRLGRGSSGEHPSPVEAIPEPKQEQPTEILPASPQAAEILPIPPQVAEVPPSPPQGSQSELETLSNVKKVGNSFVINITGASFEVNSAALSEEAKEQFAQAAVTIAKIPNLKLRVEGHTDSVGGADKNLSLSQARAESVKTFLVEYGVNGDNITATGFGESKPIADNDSEEGRAENRRVEVYIDSEGN